MAHVVHLAHFENAVRMVDQRVETSLMVVDIQGGRVVVVEGGYMVVEVGGGGIIGGAAAIRETSAIIVHRSVIVIDIDVVTATIGEGGWYGAAALFRVLLGGGLGFLLGFLTSLPLHTSVLKPDFHLEQT